MSNAFLEAVKAGDLPTIKLMLEENPARITEVDIQGSTALICSAAFGQLESVKWLLQEGGASIGEVDDDGNSALICAAQYGELETVKWLLKEGGASIRESNNDGYSALLAAADYGQLETVKWLLKVGGARFGEASNDGNTALICAAASGELATAQYLLEHEGADIGDTLSDGDKIWDLLAEYLVEGEKDPEDHDEDDKPFVYDATVVTSLLRVMVLRGAPPAELTARLSPAHAQVVEEGARLKAGLSAYLVQRHVLLDAHCPLIPPLWVLVHGYEQPTTTDELWATGLGTVRQRAVRARADDGAAAIPLRRSLRLRQKRE
jgi:hypothetical protein